MAGFASLFAERVVDEIAGDAAKPGAQFSGSRRSRNCFQAATKVSCAKSSLWLKLPVAL